MQTRYFIDTPPGVTIITVTPSCPDLLGHTSFLQTPYSAIHPQFLCLVHLYFFLSWPLFSTQSLLISISDWWAPLISKHCQHWPLQNLAWPLPSLSCPLGMKKEWQFLGRKDTEIGQNITAFGAWWKRKHTDEQQRSSMRLNNMTYLVRLRQASTDTLSNLEGKVGTGDRTIRGGGWD